MVLRNVPITYTLDQQRQEINNLATDFNAVEVVFNNTQWDLAYGWGDHASAGYLTSLPAHTHAFTSLTDTPTTLTADKWLKVNSGGTAFEFTDAPTDIDTHLNQNNPTSGYVLSWNGSAYVWVAQTTDTVYTNSDVDTHLNQSNPTSGHVLSWNGSDYSWVAQTGGGGSSTTINNNADNRIITGSATANTLEAESDLTYDGSTLTIGGTSSQVIVGSAGDLWAENALYVGDYNSTTIALSANGTASFGSGNHVLNANGTGTFAGPLNVGSALNDGSGVNIYGGGSIYIRQTGTGSADKLLIIQNNNSAEVANLNGAGGATFVGEVTCGLAASTTSRAIAGFNTSTSNPTILAQNNSAGNVWEGWTGVGSAAKTSHITGAGDATFSGSVGIGPSTIATSRKLHIEDTTTAFSQWTTGNTGSTHTDGTLVGVQADSSFQIWNYEDSYFRIATNNVERLKITAAGASNFTGPINITGELMAYGTNAAGYVYVDSDGAITIEAPDDSSQMFKAGGPGNQDAITFNSSGNSTFEGKITANHTDGIQSKWLKIQRTADDGGEIDDPNNIIELYCQSDGAATRGLKIGTCSSTSGAWGNQFVYDATHPNGAHYFNVEENNILRILKDQVSILKKVNIGELWPTGIFNNTQTFIHGDADADGTGLQVGNSAAAGSDNETAYIHLTPMTGGKGIFFESCREGDYSSAANSSTSLNLYCNWTNNNIKRMRVREDGGYRYYTHDTYEIFSAHTTSDTSPVWRFFSGSSGIDTGTVRAYIRADGGYYYAGSNVSDRDLKENITNLESGSLNLIKQLTPCTYNFKVSEGYEDTTKTGFIAQNVASVFGTDNGVATGTDGQKDMCVDYNGITAHLTAALQEAIAKIETLEAKVAALEAA